MTFPLVQELAAEGFPVRLTCGVLGFSRQAFYKWQARPVCDRDWEDAHLTNAIVDVHADEPEFGYRFIADELDRAGHRVGEGRVHRLCRQQRVWSTTTRKGRRHSGRRPGVAVHDDHVRREFSAPAPDLVWLTDITEHPTAEGKLYCCAVKDVFSNRIVGYAIDERMTAPLAVGALRQLTAAGLTGSMGRVASAGDNAAMESFFALLQTNVLDRRRWRTRDELRYAIIRWIEHTYNRQRRQRALGRLTPIEYELTFA